MIDFRYHLVSLISVFLALAVGIILGAGPLQNAIGDQLNEQVAALRTERTDLRDSLGRTEAELADQHAYALAAGAELAAGSLEGMQVAVVDVDGLPDTVEIEVVNQLEDAGARVVAQSSLTPAWTSAEESVLRSTVADGQRGNLGESVADDATTAQVLGTVLGTALTESDPQVPGVPSQRSTDLYELLTTVGLVESRFAPSAPADAVLLLADGGEEAAASESAEASETPEDVDMVSTSIALESVAGTVVVAAPTVVDGDLVAEIRADEDAVTVLSTVSGIEQDVMRFDVPLAIAAHSAGEIGQYGFEEGATVVPPVVDRSDGGEDEGSAADGGAADDGDS
ncbi:copper transporter [Isoptericola aurantiacus]|uniref:copper transporter n=1 Tax=Isoptericola aurantiacus TaxID=3377839 RepID=UPI00383A97F6